MKKITQILLAGFISILVFSACEKDEPIVEDPQNTVPVIKMIQSDKDTIIFGGNDPATITVDAEGGGLTYNWTVDLGDFFPLNTEKSQMEYTASDCCIGDKTIYCTVTNDKGTVTDSVMIFIKLEE